MKNDSVGNDEHDYDDDLVMLMALAILCSLQVKVKVVFFKLPNRSLSDRTPTCKCCQTVVFDITICVISAC